MNGLSRHQVEQFEDQGFLVVENLLDPVEDIDPVIEEYEGVLDRLADELFEAGAITSRHGDLPFGQRMIRIQLETGRQLVQHFDFSLPQQAITADTPIWVGKAIFDILSNTRLLDAMESFIGPEIYSNPVQHVRMKMPEVVIPTGLSSDLMVARTPWHQDMGVLTEEADHTNMITVWFPLWDAPLEAGPLQVVPYSHREGLLTHCPFQGTVSIPEKVLTKGHDAVPLPMRRGDVLFLHNKTAHASLPNTSDDIRWSFDLRYHPIGQPTGRDAFPGFVARSRRAPETELHDWQAWADDWHATRARLAAEGIARPFNRWDSAAAVCA